MLFFSNKSFTGDIVKYDQERRQLIVKNFKRVCPRLFQFLRIQKISLVPNNIRIAQQKERFNPLFFCYTRTVLLAPSFE